MKISSWPRTFSCPTYSASVAGRSDRSNCSSCGEPGLAEINRSVSTVILTIPVHYAAHRCTGATHCLDSHAVTPEQSFTVLSHAPWERKLVDATTISN